MRKLVLKSLLFGSIVGVVFFVIAPLGLGIRFIEILKPILVPGIYLLKTFWKSNNISVVQWMFSIGLNILAYSLFFLVLFSLRRRIGEKNILP